MMKHANLTVPEIGLIAGTRAAAGAGLALLLCNRLNPDQRRAVGWTLLAVGIATTIPLVAPVFAKNPVRPRTLTRRKSQATGSAGRQTREPVVTPFPG